MLLAGWLIHGFLAALLWAGVIAVSSWPWYEKFKSMLPAQFAKLGAPLFTLLVAALFLGPLGYILYQLGHEARVLAEVLKTAQQVGLPKPEWVDRLPFFGHAASDWWQEVLAAPGGVKEWLLSLDLNSVLGVTRHLGIEMAHRLVILGVTLLTLFFLFRDGELVAPRILALIRELLGESGVSLALRAADTVRATMNGLVLVGLGEGLLLGVSYWIAGLDSPTLWGVATALIAPIPFAMPAVFASASIILFAHGSQSAALAVLAWGAAVMFVADHFVRPALIGGAARLPLIWILLGILGGIESFGLLGLFLGPAIMALAMAVWREWTDG